MCDKSEHSSTGEGCLASIRSEGKEKGRKARKEQERRVSQPTMHNNMQYAATHIDVICVKAAHKGSAFLLRKKMHFAGSVTALSSIVVKHLGG